MTHTPTPFLVDGCTVYALNDYGVNRVSAYVQPGHTGSRDRTTAEECKSTAEFLAKAANSHDRLVEALRAILWANDHRALVWDAECIAKARKVLEACNA